MNEKVYGKTGLDLLEDIRSYCRTDEKRRISEGGGRPKNQNLKDRVDILSCKGEAKASKVPGEDGVTSQGWCIYDGAFNLMSLCEQGKKADPDWQNTLEQRTFGRSRTMKIVKRQFDETMKHGDTFAEWDKGRHFVVSHMARVITPGPLLARILVKHGIYFPSMEEQWFQDLMNWQIEPDLGGCGACVFHTWTTFLLSYPISMRDMEHVATVDVAGMPSDAK